MIEAVDLVYSSSTTSRRESCSLLSAQNRSIVGNIPESGAFLLDNASKLPDFVRTKCSAPHSVRLNQQPLKTESILNHLQEPVRLHRFGEKIHAFFKLRGPSDHLSGVSRHVDHLEVGTVES